MNQSPQVLARPIRWLLMACGPMNLLGAFCFSPPIPFARQMLHLPESDPFYLWILSAWILGFGIAYFHQGWTGRANRTILALGIWGKLTFVCQLLIVSANDNWFPLSWLAAIPDLSYALLFAWLLSKPRSHSIMDQ